MHVDIVPTGSVNLQMMHDLDELREQLRADGLDATGSRAALPGVKDGGLTIAIAIGGLVASSVSSLISALSYWSSQKPSYTLTVQAGTRTLQISQLDRKGARAALEQLSDAKQADNMVVRVSGPE